MTDEHRGLYEEGAYNLNYAPGRQAAERLTFGRKRLGAAYRLTLKPGAVLRSCELTLRPYRDAASRARWEWLE